MPQGNCMYEQGGRGSRGRVAASLKGTGRLFSLPARLLCICEKNFSLEVTHHNHYQGPPMGMHSSEHLTHLPQTTALPTLPVLRDVILPV